MTHFAPRSPWPRPYDLRKASERGRLDFPNDLSAPGRTRTCDPRLRRPPLYPTELRARPTLSTTLEGVHEHAQQHNAARRRVSFGRPRPRPLDRPPSPKRRQLGPDPLHRRRHRRLQFGGENGHSELLERPLQIARGLPVAHRPVPLDENCPQEPPEPTSRSLSADRRWRAPTVPARREDTAGSNPGEPGAPTRASPRKQHVEVSSDIDNGVLGSRVFGRAWRARSVASSSVDARVIACAKRPNDASTRGLPAVNTSSNCLLVRATGPSTPRRNASSTMRAETIARKASFSALDEADPSACANAGESLARSPTGCRSRPAREVCERQRRSRPRQRTPSPSA